MSLLVVSDLVVGYAGGPSCFVGNRKITDGSVVVLTGPSGSGKSTILRTLLGTLTPLRGHIQWQGQQGWVPQQTYWEYPLPTTLGEVIAGQVQPPCPDRLAHILQILRLTDRTSQPWNASSGGERQRALLARALSAHPETLLLDEPVSQVDMPTVQLFLDALRHYHQQGGTMLVSAHQPDLIDALSSISSNCHHWHCAEGTVTND